MKVGLIVPGFSADERDWCIPALLNFARWVAADHDLHVFALHYPFRRAVYSVFGATVHSLNGRNRRALHRLGLWRDAQSALSAEHARGRFDVLHAFWANEPGFIATLAGRAFKIPTVVSLAGGELVGLANIGYGSQLHALDRWQVNFALQRATRVTAGSQYLQELARSRGVEAQRVPLGVDVKMFSPIPPSRDQVKRILNVASLRPVKGHSLLLQAFAQLARSETRLEIVGQGPLESHLRAQAKALHISDRVVFSGTIPHNVLAAKYREADVVVQSSWHEAQGMAILEAAACDQVIAGTRVGILPELARTDAAVAVSPNGASVLADALKSALETREQVGCRPADLVACEFGLQVVTTRWVELYQTVLRF